MVVILQSLRGPPSEGKTTAEDNDADPLDHEETQTPLAKPGRFYRFRTRMLRTLRGERD
jgi:hypothetical protein